MCSLVDLEVLGPREESVAAGKGAHEGLLPGVDPHVVHELVLGFEGLALPRTLLPVTRMVTVLRAPDVVDGQMVDDVVHRVEHLVADLLRVGVLPHTHRVHLGAGGLLLHVPIVWTHVCSVSSVTSVI